MKRFVVGLGVAVVKRLALGLGVSDVEPKRFDVVGFGVSDVESKRFDLPLVCCESKPLNNGVA